MTRSRDIGIVSAVAALFCVLALLTPRMLFGEDARERPDRIPGQYIVVLKDTVNDAEAVEQEIVSRVRGERLASYRSALRGFAARFSDTELASVENDPRVAFVSEDRMVALVDASRGERASREVEALRVDRRAPSPEPPPAPSPTPAPAPIPPNPPAKSPAEEAANSDPVFALSDLVPGGINRIAAGSSALKGTGVHVAIIDTGIETNHPDLAGNIAGGKNCSTGTSYADGNGHGTHVAGTIAALDNGSGVIGIAPEAKLWAVRVLNNSGAGSWSTVICGIDFVTSKAPKNGGPITVANLSLGGGGVSDNNCGNSNNDALHKAICRARDAGVTVVVAAGNSGANAASFVPAAYQDAVVTVSALVDTDGAPWGAGSPSGYGADDTFASFSNWGTPVDIGAPGVSIYSTWIGSGYRAISGTSMASPHAAGAVALYREAYPNATFSEVRDALVASGEPLGSGHSDPSGRHPEPVLRVDALAALWSGGEPPPKEPPTEPAPEEPPPVVAGFADSFENGLGAWESVHAAWQVSTARATDGSRSIEVDGYASNAAITSGAIDLGGSASASVTFDWYIESGLDPGEYLKFDISKDGGSTWEEVAMLRGNVDAENTWHAKSITVSGVTSLKIRFRGSMSTSSEDAYVDNVKVVAL